MVWLLLDKDDNVIRPAILWNDGRTGEETEYLNEVIGKDKLSEYTANIAFAGFTAPKILWMKESMNRRILKKSQRLCCRKIIWHTSFQDRSVQMYRMHRECCLWM